MSKTKVLLYGDVDLNVIDGSAIWLPAIAEAWSKAGSEVHVQLKAVEKRDLLTGPLRALPNVTVLEANPPRSQSALQPTDLSDRLIELDAQHHFDVVMVRGINACLALTNKGVLSDKLWSYVTEFGYASETFDAVQRTQIATIARGSRVMLAQTAAARSVLEARVPEAAGRTEILGPMIPDELEPNADGTRGNKPLELVYAGKFARAWRTDLMPDIVAELASLGVPAHLTMIGDKVHNEPQHPGWAANMRAVMAKGDAAVKWAGAKSREESLRLVSQSDLALGWRTDDLDLSLEISTKVLESSAVGVASIVNRTTMHEELLGGDYPLFVDARQDSAADIARKIAEALPQLETLSARVRAVSDPYRLSRRAEDLQRYLSRWGTQGRRIESGEARAETAPTSSSTAGLTSLATAKTLKVGLAGHDLKFAGELIEMLRRDSAIELRIDKWAGLHKHDELASQRLVDWADVVICEWAGANSVWYSQHKRPGQRLFVRLHMFELRGHWLPQIAVDQVDQFIAVSEHYRQYIIDELGAEPERVRVIPNAISIADLDREPIEGREFRLGIVGIVPLRKRLDRAVALLRRLRAHDDRFTLHVRGKMPWEHPHEWRKARQRESYMDLFSKIGGSDLNESIAFEPFGADMGNWYRKIGWVLSPSTVESFHLAPAEGMASGAVPLLWDRPGVRDIFGDDFVVANNDEAAKFVLDSVDDVSRLARYRSLARRVAENFDEKEVERLWSALIHVE
ncbi:MAG: glycosyltransferase [Gulosibacter sp.]|uniref:glycosyltransferase n=1 Tax=Gulosibacter sp. TaxID=2817531 RepID=UPI003F92FED0